MSSDYRTVVVGTDGSSSSLLAVERAAKIASAFNSRLVIASAFYPPSTENAPLTKGESVVVIGEEQAAQNLAAAREHALQWYPHAETKMEEGSPVSALMAIVKAVRADLLVVGNRGINSLTGRLLGSVPADVARQSDCDVMIVHTVGVN
ncbi:universal stress protein [Corynebacterium caspium]|uniref:universal stress protein n=1 Tax=Corynebacterium caspium TaxID=234828 RepID=UPI00036AF7D0|nr:universal stress protein [Corynebacterium caspium]WKD59379.1 Universal stress protein [Corynebacterium caspium DSM 44850]